METPNDLNKTSNVWGITSLILGILGIILFLAPYIGIFLAIMAIVFYSVQKKKGINGIATTGLILGIIGVVLDGVILLFLIGLLSIFGSGSKSNTIIKNKNDSTSVITSKTDDDKETYLKNYLKIEDLKVGKGYGRYDMPGYSTEKSVVSGKIRNTGKKVLSRVEITIYFLDSEGKRIGEKSYIPISHFSVDDDSPLKPNYVRDWGYVVDENAPSGWSKKVEAVINDLSFSE